MTVFPLERSLYGPPQADKDIVGGRNSTTGPGDHLLVVVIGAGEVFCHRRRDYTKRAAPTKMGRDGKRDRTGQLYSLSCPLAADLAAKSCPAACHSLTAPPSVLRPRACLASAQHLDPSYRNVEDRTLRTRDLDAST